MGMNKIDLPFADLALKRRRKGGGISLANRRKEARNEASGEERGRRSRNHQKREPIRADE